MLISDWSSDVCSSDLSPVLGPDATGLGWIYQYALVDRSGRHHLGELRALQDWFLRYELKTIPDVAEVATVGGMVQAWQIIPDPQALAARGITVEQVIEAIRAANGAPGGSVIEQAGADVVVRSTGYLQTREDFEKVPVTTGGVPVLLGAVASGGGGPTPRRGIPARQRVEEGKAGVERVD